MAGVNKVILVGNLGRDPELRHLEGGLSVARFSLATTEIHKDKNGNRVEHTEWHNIVMWRGLADNAEKLLKKGSQIYLEGKLQTRDWQDKEGHKRQSTEIVAESFLLLGKKDTGGSTNPGNIESSGMTGINGGNNDIPF